MCIYIYSSCYVLFSIYIYIYSSCYVLFSIYIYIVLVTYCLVYICIYIVLVTYCLESLVDPGSGVVVVEKYGCEYVLAASRTLLVDTVS